MCNQCENNPVVGRKFKNPQVWETTKKCTKCGKHKCVLKDFYVSNKKRKDGTAYKSVNAVCKSCAADTHAKNAEGVEFRARSLVTGSRNRSLKKDIKHDLTLEWVLERLEKGVCEVTGLPFTFDKEEIKGGKRSFNPSLDRTDPTKGYTMDNVKVVCWIYNGAKGVGPHEDVIKLAEALINVK